MADDVEATLHRHRRLWRIPDGGPVEIHRPNQTGSGRFPSSHCSDWLRDSRMMILSSWLPTKRPLGQLAGFMPKRFDAAWNRILHRVQIIGKSHEKSRCTGRVGSDDITALGCHANHHAVRTRHELRRLPDHGQESSDQDILRQQVQCESGYLARRFKSAEKVVVAAADHASRSRSCRSLFRCGETCRCGQRLRTRGDHPYRPAGSTRKSSKYTTLSALDHRPTRPEIVRPRS